MERIVERLLRKRFRAIPVGAGKRLSKLTADELDSLGEALLDFKDTSDR